MPVRAGCHRRNPPVPETRRAVLLSISTPSMHVRPLSLIPHLVGDSGYALHGDPYTLRYIPDSIALPWRLAVCGLVREQGFAIATTWGLGASWRSPAFECVSRLQSQ